MHIVKNRTRELYGRVAGRVTAESLLKRESLHRVLPPDFCTVGYRVAMPAYMSAVHGDKVCIIVCEKLANRSGGKVFGRVCLYICTRTKSACKHISSSRFLALVQEWR